MNRTPIVLYYIYHRNRGYSHHVSFPNCSISSVCMRESNSLSNDGMSSLLHLGKSHINYY